MRQWIFSAVFLMVLGALPGFARADSPPRQAGPDFAQFKRDWKELQDLQRKQANEKRDRAGFVLVLVAVGLFIRFVVWACGYDEGDRKPNSD
jgi:hypothetical protein